MTPKERHKKWPVVVKRHAVAIAALVIALLADAQVLSGVAATALAELLLLASKLLGS